MSTVDEIRILLDDFAVALSNGDSDAMVAHFAQDARLLVADAPVVDGRTAIAASFKQSIDDGLRAIDSETIDVIEHGPIVVEIGHEVLRYEFPEVPPLLFPANYVAVYRRRADNQLEIIVDIVNGDTGTDSEVAGAQVPNISRS
jgi:ketosteroid isomerase-like protein